MEIGHRNWRSSETGLEREARDRRIEVGERHDASLCFRPDSHATALRVLKLILDTNIVLDWLVYRDEGVAGLQPAVDRNLVEIITHAPAIDELRRVLAYPRFKLTTREQQDTLERYTAQTRLVTLPADATDERLPPGFPRCRDRDDQHFLVLAHHERDAALVSKDVDLLTLTRRARKFGITVLDLRQLTSILQSLDSQVD